MPSGGAAGGGNLPAEVSSFVGRRQERVDVKRLMSDARLVTLTGVGGTGKTRLARRVAADVRLDFADGVWFIDLSDLQQPWRPFPDVDSAEALGHLVVATVGLRDQPGSSSLRRLAEQLADRCMLLVLDNCEHLLPICATLAEALLGACPRLQILATSRELLAVPGEETFAVSPLPVPEPGSGSSLADLVRTEAVALFLARARAVVRGFHLTEHNRDAVVELCRRLDGLPLAIELAAARIRVLEPQQLLDRLTERFALLSRGSRTAPERQQTLRACVDWSFGLCTKDEQMLWARLTVFTCSFELDAIEGVCADEQLPAAVVLDVVAGLADKSILTREGHGSVARHRMLDTIHDFGREKLDLIQEQAMLRRRHRDWHERLLLRAQAEWITDRQPYWLARLGREHPDLRAAVEYCLTEPGEAEAALRMVVCLPVHYWWTRGVLGECRRWLERALALTDAPTALRARSLLLASDLGFVHGDRHNGMRLLDQGEELARRLDDPTALAHAAYARGIATLQRNDPQTAAGCFERALASLGFASGPGHGPEAQFDLHVRLLIGLGVAAAMAGQRERASTCRETMLAMTDCLGSDFYRSSALWSCGLVSWLGGDLELAAAEVREGLRLKQAYRVGDDFGAALSLEVLAWIIAGESRHQPAATLLGAADAIRDGQGTSLASFRHLLSHHEQCERRLRDALGDEAFADAFRHGKTLAYPDVLAFALNEPAPDPVTSAARGPTALTPREAQIAELIADGLSNREIAATLFITPRTAAAHVEHILAKLRFTNRTQVAAWTTARRADQPTPDAT